MTWRQSFLKTIYPLIMLKAKLFPNNSSILQNKNVTIAPQSFYSLQATANDGSTLNFETFRNKKVLIVNTASNCGYTNQYDELEKLYQQQKNNLIILAFPANDFKQQESANDEAIASFCKVNYGVTFPIIKKATVIKNNEQHPVFSWLTNSNKNGWCNQQPTWNFNKYLINEQGILTHVFDQNISPLDKNILEALK